MKGLYFIFALSHFNYRTMNDLIVNENEIPSLHKEAGTGAEIFHIPQRFRKMENLHIVFWLLKDISWCMIWRPLGLAMIFPTFIIACIIAWRTRRIMSELCHNLAVVLWIFANSYWMTSEFFQFDSWGVYGDISFKELTVIPFAVGILILAWFYLWYAPRNRNHVKSF